MKIKLDENLPARLAPILKKHGHDVDTVPEEHLGGRPDAESWQAVSSEGRFLITQDLDFSDTRQFAPGTHAGLLLVRLQRTGCTCPAGSHQRRCRRDRRLGRLLRCPH